MTTKTLKRANELKERISELDIFLLFVRTNYVLRLFNKPLKRAKKLTLCSSDYMRPFKYYEVSGSTREKIIQILEEEREELQKELDNL